MFFPEEHENFLSYEISAGTRQPADKINRCATTYISFEMRAVAVDTTFAADP
jgi:hypothetical protein